VDDERRVQLLEDVAVPVQQQPEELLHVVRDEIQLEVGSHLGDLDRGAAFFEANHLLGGQDVDTAQIEVRVGRRKAVEVGAADRREQQRVRLCCRDRAQPGIVAGVHEVGRHVTALLRALMRNRFAAS
jgi:hypothetical protein